ncbi:hypothetical protein MNBD_IGNAVI01-2054 [hydrothermal vent metagenome]|uniref:Uncharacterized protein n=1 Tax=hydrothermal vent metagenome TaxID=652676 RepID=A0A3B1BK38_9ZZZZ
MKKLINILILLAFLSPLVFSQTSLNNKYRLAKTYEQNGELQKAKSIYKELVTAQPFNIQYANSLNGIYMKLKEYDNSVKFLTERIAANPNDVSLYGMLGSTYYLMGNGKKAVEAWNKGIKVNNNSLINYTIISNFTIQNRAFEYAIKYLKEGKEKADNPTQFSYQLAQVYSITMDFGNATDEYCQVLLKQPKQLDYVKRRIQTYLSAPGAVEQSIAAAKKYSDNNTIQELLVFLYMQDNQYDNAYNLIVDLDTKLKRQGVLVYNFANDAFYGNEFAASKRAFEFIIKNHPKSPLFTNSQIGYAKTLEAELDNLLVSNQEWKPIKAIDTTGAYKYYPVLKTYNKILQKIKRTEAVNEVLYRIGLIKLNRFDDLDGAAADFTKILKNSTLSQFYGIANLRLADISIRKGKLEDAKNHLINSFSSVKTPKDLKSEAKYKLALIQFWNSQFDRSLKTISDLTKDLSNNNANDAIELSIIINMGKRDSLNLVKFAEADLLTWQKNFTKAGEIFRNLGGNENFYLLNNISQFKYAEILIVEDDYPVAIEILKELSEKEKLNIFTDKSLFLLAQVYEYGISDKKSALSIYENILEHYPNSLYLDKARESIKRLQTI